MAIKYADALTQLVNFKYADNLRVSVTMVRYVQRASGQQYVASIEAKRWKPARAASGHFTLRQFREMYPNGRKQL
jgi:hypothetical protein